nr:MAG TPA: hypothetical protein [Caudoviricetes sp.]
MRTNHRIRLFCILHYFFIFVFYFKQYIILKTKEEK